MEATIDAEEPLFKESDRSSISQRHSKVFWCPKPDFGLAIAKASFVRLSDLKPLQYLACTANGRSVAKRAAKQFFEPARKSH